MAGRTLTTITLLLATALFTQMIKACQECREECNAYKVAKDTTGDSLLNVEAVLRDFRNTPKNFNDKIGTDYEADRTPGVTGEACYLANADLGCSHFLEVDRARSWTYQCDYDKNRLPLYLWRASCGSDSETIYYTVPVLKRDDSCNPQPTWQLVMEKVPVGCSYRH